MGRLFSAFIFLAILLVGFSILSLESSSKRIIIGSTIENIEEEAGNGELKVFVLTGENFKFMIDGIENPEIKVEKGDRVRIEFESVGGFHDWSLDEFGAKTERVEYRGITSVEFIADKKGVFEYYCSVGSHRLAGMNGIFVVE